VLRVGGADGRERMIPLVPAHVDAIERAGQRIVVDWELDY
jgi:ribosomal 30S subunit maturation factor RimM